MGLLRACTSAAEPRTEALGGQRPPEPSLSEGLHPQGCPREGKPGGQRLSETPTKDAVAKKIYEKCRGGISAAFRHSASGLPLVLQVPGPSRLFALVWRVVGAAFVQEGHALPP